MFRNTTKKFRGIGIFTALLATLLLGGCDNKQAGAPPPPPPPPEVATITVEPQRLVLTSELPGRISACLVAEVRPQVSGLIKERLFVEGSDVEAGQTLYLLDDALFQSALDNAEANLTAARNKAKQARAALEASQAAVEQLRSELSLARSNEARFETLAADGAASLSEREQYETKAEVAAAALRSSEAQVTSARQAVEVAEAGISQAQAAVGTARINLAYSRITAPISGRIGKSNVTVGSLVTAHQPLALTTIQQLDPIYVDVPQSHAELLRLRNRLETNHLENNPNIVKQVHLVLENGQTYPHEGILQFRDVTVDPSTNSVLIRMSFPNPDGILLPGMFARAVINEGVNPSAILVPQQAISRDTKSMPYALILDESGKVEQRMVTLEKAYGNQWLVSEGLSKGDRVIVEGMQKVRHGSEAKAIPFDEPKAEQTAAESAGNQPESNAQ